MIPCGVINIRNTNAVYSMGMIKVYFKELPEYSLVPLIQTLKDHTKYNKNVAYIKDVLDAISQQFVVRVATVEEADFILFPHYYSHLLDRHAYFDETIELSQEHQKKILLFLFEDEIYNIDWPNTLIFRSSINRTEMKPYEFSLPPIVADLSKGRTVLPLPKPSVPIVGFVGWAGFNNKKRALKAYVKNLVIRLIALFTGPLYLARNQQGIFLRRYLLKLVAKDIRVKDASIVRTAYAGFTRDFSVEIVQKQREEYIENMIHSHFTLSPRGDGNFSQRFFECLSVGRFPVLVDTDTALPLQDIIPYERFVVMVPYEARAKTIDYIINFMQALDDEEFIKRQEEAKYYFDMYLSVEGYYSYLFTQEKIRDYLGSRTIE